LICRLRDVGARLFLYSVLICQTLSPNHDPRRIVFSGSVPDSASSSCKPSGIPNSPSSERVAGEGSCLVEEGPPIGTFHVLLTSHRPPVLVLFLEDRILYLGGCEVWRSYPIYPPHSFCRYLFSESNLRQLFSVCYLVHLLGVFFSEVPTSSQGSLPLGRPRRSSKRHA